MKLVTYNIQYSLGRDGCYDLSRIADTVAGADIIALQEVERFWPRSGMVDQPLALGRMLPEHYWVYGPAFDVDASRMQAGRVVNRRRQFGTMLMSRSPIVSSRLHLLPKLATVNRFNMDLGALEGVIETGAGPLRLYSLHLNHLSSRERCMQIERLLRLHRRAVHEGGAWCGIGTSDGEDWTAGEPMPPMPLDAVLLGDFNSEPGGPEYVRLVGPRDARGGDVYHADGFVDSWLAAGNGDGACITWRPTSNDPRGGDGCRLDYCFVSSRIADRVRRAWVQLDAEGSDHYPYWVELDV